MGDPMCVFLTNLLQALSLVNNFLTFPPKCIVFCDLAKEVGM